MAEHWNGGTGGKGSKPRPFNISQEEYGDRFEAIFGKKKKKEVVEKSDYQDILSTEDCMLDALDKLDK
jgi:hypothetical protein